MIKREASVARKTTETEINLFFRADGTGDMEGSSGIGFLDHMLILFCKHGGFELQLKSEGDLQVDGHHTAEDIGLCLGEAFNKSLGDKCGLERYGSVIMPMDETLIICAVDISGRAGLFFDAGFLSDKIGDFDTELVKVFWDAFANSARSTIHIRQIAAGNSHHVAEGIFKGMARALKSAVKITGEKLPSSKGVI